MLKHIDNLRQLSFSEQLFVLEQVEKEKQVEAIPALLALLADPLGNDAVDNEIAAAFKALLPTKPKDLIKGLGSENTKIQLLCIQAAKEGRVEAAVRKLRKMAREETDSSTLFKLLSALVHINPTGNLDIFRRFVSHADTLVASLCIEALGIYGDINFFKKLRKMVEIAESDDRYERCDVKTQSAIEAIAKLGTDEAIAFLVSKIHHKNPTARMFIGQEIVKLGMRAIPFLDDALKNCGVDEKVLASLALGCIGKSEAIDVLVSAFDRGEINDPRVRLAFYEAVGKVESLKALVCLVDGLSEKNEMLLTAAMAALDSFCHPGIIDQIRASMKTDELQKERLLRAVAAARAKRIFACLYQNPELAEPLLLKVEEMADTEGAEIFMDELKARKENFLQGIDRLSRIKTRKHDKRILAVDDSKPVRLFYRTVVAEMGCHVSTASDGVQAINIIAKEPPFDLVITDLNMPIMDGVELTKRLRENPRSRRIPIIMATTESQSSQVRLAKTAGVSSFVQKPLTLSVLKKEIKKFLKTK